MTKTNAPDEFITFLIPAGGTPDGYKDVVLHEHSDGPTYRQIRDVVKGLLTPLPHFNIYFETFPAIAICDEAGLCKQLPVNQWATELQMASHYDRGLRLQYPVVGDVVVVTANSRAKLNGWWKRMMGSEFDRTDVPVPFNLPAVPSVPGCFALAKPFDVAEHEG